MIRPSEVASKVKKLEDENLRFCSWLKAHADEEELDARFRTLHEKLFVDYDCCQCANCCREFQTKVKPREISAMAEQLGMTVFEFAEKYTIMIDDDGERTRGFDAPCPMLATDGSCRVQACKPEECVSFPHADKPDRLSSMYSVLSAASICPVVLEILQRLKQMYGFRRR